MSFQLSFISLDQTYQEIEIDNNFNSLLLPTAVHIDANANYSQATQVISINNSLLSTSYPNFEPWKISKKLRNLKNRFENIILYQYPCVPCSYCSRLLYPDEVRWVLYNSEIIYPLIKAFPNISLQFHPNQSIPKIASCCSCVKPSTRRLPPTLNSVPEEIEAVPSYHRIYLSPIHLSCSLGRTPESNNYTNYRHLQGSFGYSKNINAFALYTGTIGAILNNEMNSWYHPTLLNAANWLRNNNPLFYQYNHFYTRGNLRGPPLTIPIANLISDNSPQHQQYSGPSNLVIQNQDFDTEIHNEDYHFTRLMAGFLTNSTDKKLPISYNDPDLEALLFPDLFPLGKGHFKDWLSSHEHRMNIDTFGSYIRLYYTCPDSRFRLSWYWPHISYLNLEKLRNHQNRTRILRQKIANREHLPTIANLIVNSIYSNTPIISEIKTTSIPSYIRTGDTYWRQKEHHLNTMVHNFGLPQIFYTMTMAESKWKHLKKILQITDNHNSIPTNRSYHVYEHYHHRLKSIHHYLWKNSNLTGWGKWLHHFERDEFQNRGAIHTHGVAWLEKTISELINENIIRADLPDPNTEPELYRLVKENNIHNCCMQHCGGPAPLGQRCKYGFPQLLSNITHHDSNNMRYTYRRIKPEDQWVVPYHAPTLLLWEGHCNIQYITDKNFAKYICKYVTKPEPSDLFEINEFDAFKRHVHARRLGTMELVMLILGKSVSRSSVAVIFLPSTSPSNRQRSIRPAHQLIQNFEMDPYYDDAIEKYFNRPQNLLFNNITYPEYHRKFKSVSAIPSSNLYWMDQQNNIIVRRKKEILLRFQYMTIKDAEDYFYQQLLLRIPVWSDEQLKGEFIDYRSRFEAEFSDIYQSLVTTGQQSSEMHLLQYTYNYQNLINNLIVAFHNDLKVIIENQLLNLIKPIKNISALSTLFISNDQYEVYNIIIKCWGPSHLNNKHPFFFLTGSAGTGKSYMISLIVEYLKSKNKNFLLMAPTGVAAQNINGKTIHSELRISGTSDNFQSLAIYDKDLCHRLQNIEFIIIEEASMVSDILLTFISKLFGKIHKNSLEFGGIPILLVGDLAQLPPVKGSQVFYSPVWKNFFPLFLTTTYRQQDDIEFFNVLQEIRVGNLSQSSINLINSKVAVSQNNPLMTTHIVGYRKTADMINNYIVNFLPLQNENTTPLISYSTDHMNGQEWTSSDDDKLFKRYTNFPSIITLVPGTRVMFLHNHLFSNGLHNGSIGVVLEILDEENIIVAFPLAQGISCVKVIKETVYFNIYGSPAQRRQFPLQNAFALTVHKTQGLTLPHSTVSIDESMFATGQAYVALSRSPSWESLNITSFDVSAIKVDKQMLVEYTRLKDIFDKRICEYRQRISGIHE